MQVGLYDLILHAATLYLLQFPVYRNELPVPPSGGGLYIYPSLFSNYRRRNLGM